MSFIDPRSGRFPVGSFTAGLGFRPSDAQPFGQNIRLRPDRIFARHIDSGGGTLGWEVYTAGRDGKPRVTYTRGAPKGLVATGWPTWKSGRIILVEGALAALAAATLHPAELGETVMVVGLGGHWNAEVLEEVLGLAINARACCIDVGITEHHPAGQRMREQALADLEGRTFVRPFPTPPEGWRAALLASRSGPATPTR